MSKITIYYNINDIDKTIDFDITQKASVFKYKVCKEESMQSESLEFYYKDNPLTAAGGDRVLKDIFGSDPKPKILVLAIGVLPKDKKKRDQSQKVKINDQSQKEKINKVENQGGNKRYDEQTPNNQGNISPRKHVNYSPFKKLKMEEMSMNDLKNPTIGVLVENFPSKDDLFEMVKEFVKKNLTEENNKYKTVSLGNNNYELNFQTLEIAYEFLIFFSLEKFKKKTNSKSRASLELKVAKVDKKFDHTALVHNDLKKKPYDFLAQEYTPGKAYQFSLEDSLNKSKIYKTSVQKPISNLLARSVERLNNPIKARSVKLNKISDLYNEDHADYEKMLHQKAKEFKPINNKEFIPYCGSIRSMEKNYFNHLAPLEKFEDSRFNMREVDKSKWIEEDNYFRTTVRAKSKIY